MESTPKLSRDKFIAQTQAKLEETLGRVAGAINEAPPGYIISGSEEQVREQVADLRQQAFVRVSQLFESLLRTMAGFRGVRVSRCQSRVSSSSFSLRSSTSRSNGLSGRSMMAIESARL